MRKLFVPPMVAVLLYCLGMQQFAHAVGHIVYRAMEAVQWPTDASYLIVFLLASLALTLPPALWLMFKFFITPARKAVDGVAASQNGSQADVTRNGEA